MTQYKIKVVGLVENGHPHQALSFNLADASRLYDTLCETHKDKKVLMTMLEERVMKVREPEVKPQAPNCPHDHKDRLVNERPAIVKTGDHYNCRVCGWMS